MSSRIRIIALFLLLVFSAAGNVVWGYDVEWECYSSSTKGDYFKSYTASDGSVITISSPQGLTSSSGDIYLQLGSTPSNTSGYYVEVTSNGSSIASVEFLITGNGSDKSCQPVVLTWDGEIQPNAADQGYVNAPIVISNKGCNNAEWIAYDVSDNECHTVRIYRAVKQVAAPPYPYSSDAIGNAQTIFIYGVRVTLSTGEVVNRLIWSGNLRDGSTVTKYIDDLADFTYTASSSLGATCTIRYSSSNPAVASVDATTGQVRPTGVEGETVITATQQACGETASATATYTLRVMEEPLIDCSGSTVNWSESSTTSLHLPGGTYSKNNKTYYAPGVYMDTTEYYANGCPKKILILTLGCDTTVQLCVGDTYTWDRNGVTYDTKGDKETMSYKVHMPNGKDYTYTIKLKITQPSTAVKTYSDTKATIIRGSSYHWFGKDYTEQGIYEDVIRNAAGCDSIGTLTLGVCGNVPDTGIVRAIINQGDSYYWRYRNISYFESTHDTVMFVTKYGCDSVAILDLTVQAVPAGHLAVTICEGDSYTWHGTTYTEAGTYTYGTETLHLGKLPNPNIETCEDKVISLGESAQLEVTGADYYAWEPEDYLSSEWSDRPVATPPVSMTYSVKSYNSAAANVVQNGDFEMGRYGCPTEDGGTTPTFETDGFWSTESGTYGKYVIAQNAKTPMGWDDQYDHTTGDGTGYFMIMDGFIEPNKIIWQQKVKVTPNTDYIFSAWFISLHSSFNRDSYTQFQFFVNGTQLGDIAESPHEKGQWGRYYELWDSEENEEAILTIMDQNTNDKGNDFGLDDISFQALGPCFGEDSVKVIINFDVDLYSSCGHEVENRLSDSETHKVTYKVDGCEDKVGYYKKGDQITVTAHDDDECTGFIRWEEDGSTENPRIYTMGDSDMTITPIFDKKKFNVIIRSNDAESGKVTGKIE